MAAPLRVVHVVATDGLRGAEVFAADLVRALAPEGVVQTVAVLRAAGGSSPDYQVPVHSLGDGIGPDRLGLGPRRAWRLRRLVRAEPGAVVQAHGGEALKHALAASAGAPVVYRRIGTAPTTILGGPRRAGHAALMRRAAAVVAVSDAVRNETIQVFGLPAERICTIPNAVDPVRLMPRIDRAAARSALGLAGDDVVILSLGALSWEKDPLAAIAATAPLLRSDRPFVHLFAGEGPLRGEVERVVQREGLGDRVRLLRSRAEVGDVLVASDVLLFASRADGMEGMPATVIEAGFAGLPVAGYAVAGVPEVVADGESGLLCRPGDLHALTGMVAELAGDPSRRQALGAAAAARCQARFSIAAVAPEYLRLWQWLAAAPSPAAGPLPGARAAS